MSVNPKMTDKEAARELFVAGYMQALQDAEKVATTLGCDAAVQIVKRLLEEKAARVQARAAIAKAGDSAAERERRVEYLRSIEFPTPFESEELRRLSS